MASQALAAADKPRAAIDGLAHPALDAIDLVRVDQWPDLRRGVRRVSDHHRVAKSGEALGHLLSDGLVHIDALHRHAHLAGMVEAALGEEWQTTIEIGISRHDDLLPQSPHPTTPRRPAPPRARKHKDKWGVALWSALRRMQQRSLTTATNA